MVASYMPTSTDIVRSLHLLRSSDARERLLAIDVLEHVQDDPRVVLVFERLYRGDPDPRVRQAAWQAIHQAGPSVPAPAPAADDRDTAADTDPGDPLFLLDPANRDVLVRDRQQRAERHRWAHGLWMLAVLLVVVALLLVGQVASALRDWYRLDQAGITVTGTITGLRRDGDDWRMAYRFETAHGTDSNVVMDEQRTTHAAFQCLAVGSPLRVTYWPDNPLLSITEQPNPAHHVRDRQVIAASVLGGLALGFAVLGALLWGSQRGAGQPCLLLGQLKRCSGRVDMDGDFKLRVAYRFLSPVTGRLLSAEASQICNARRTSELPNPGTPVAVCYHDDDTFRLL